MDKRRGDDDCAHSELDLVPPNAKHEKWLPTPLKVGTRSHTNIKLEYIGLEEISERNRTACIMSNTDIKLECVWVYFEHFLLCQYRVLMSDNMVFCKYRE